MSFNQTTIVGRLTKDPQSRQAGEHTVVSFSVAVDNFGKDKGASFFDCQVWGKQGQFIMDYLSKGRLVVVSGRMESRTHEGKTYWTLTANDTKSLDRPKDDAPAKPKPSTVGTGDDAYNPFDDF